MTAFELIKEFQHLFQKAPERIYFCPGRVNLIGEHIDYNGGRVLPCAISLGTYLVISRNTDKQLKFKSLNFSEHAELHLQSSFSKTEKGWFNYPLGVINELLEDGHNISGLDMLFYGNLPIGAGLSSSASIEVLTCFALNSIFGFGLSKKEIAILSKKAENDFMRVNCGIMDQYAVVMGQVYKAILLNCDLVEHEYIPFETKEFDLVVINSNKQRILADSKYNERFSECGAALKLLKQELSIKQLCDISIETFEKHRYVIRNTVLEKRTLHVISENERVNEAANALKNGELDVFGKLMYASHLSLKELYEVSGKELDAIVNFCKAYNNCIGARMTGAGFGGCCIALVRKSKVDDFIKKLTADYKAKTGYQPELFISEAGDGVREIKY